VVSDPQTVPTATVSNCDHISGSASRNVVPESHAKGVDQRYSPFRVKDRSGMGESAMDTPNKLSREVLLLPVLDGAQSVRTSKGDLILSSSGVKSLVPPDNQSVIGLKQLAQNVLSGSSYVADYDHVTLSEDALNGPASSTATSASKITTNLQSEIASSSGSFTLFGGELNQLGTELQSGDPSSAQQYLLALDSTALNAAPSAGESSSEPTSMTSSATPLTQTEIIELVYAGVQGMEAGEISVLSSAMSELASVSPSSAGGRAFRQGSQSSTSGLSLFA
jgi:hypothetical protein